MNFRIFVTTTRAVRPLFRRSSRPLLCSTYATTTTTPPLSTQGQTILDHLLKTETDAESYYLDMAAKAKNQEFRDIFTMIAKEEAKHVDWLRALAKDPGALAQAFRMSDSLLGDIQNIFHTMKANRKNLNKVCSDEIELYRTARDIEGQARDFYAERAKHAKDPALRQLLEVIALEEEKHYKLLDQLLKFVDDHEESGTGCASGKGFR